MAKLIFYDDEHRYQLDGDDLPSVSELTRFISREIYTDVSQFNLDRAAERGTAVHKATESLDKYGKIEIDEDYAPYIQAYVNFRREHKHKWKHIEYATYNDKLKYAGTIDRFADDGTLLDIKTSYTVHKPLVTAQLSLYKMMLESQGEKVKKLEILQLKKDGTYKIVDVDFNEAVAMACVNLHELLKKKPRKKAKDEKQSS